MPDENPYAAPQTLGRPHLAVTVSADAPRLRFTDCSTERLQQLLDYSYAIQQMHIMWILFACLGFCTSLLFASISFVEPAELAVAVGWFTGMGFLISRVAIGYYSTRWCRGWAKFCDGLLVLAMLWLILLLLRDGAWLVACLCAFVCLHGSSSIVAYLRAQELFVPRPIDRDDLAGEVAYRQLNGIV